jgi:hypothetical protein
LAATPRSVIDKPPGAIKQLATLLFYFGGQQMLFESRTVKQDPVEEPSCRPDKAESRDQFGRTWVEQESDLRDRLSKVLEPDAVEHEVEKQRRMFDLYQELAEKPDSRQLELDRSLAETSLDSRRRVVEAAKKSWT